MSDQNVYSLLNVGKIVAGSGSINTIAAEAAEFGVEKVLIITDQGVWNAGLIAKPKALLEAAGLQVEVINTTPPEPEAGQVNSIFRSAKELGCELIIGIGGGSSMDVAKLVSVLLTNDITLSEMIDKTPIGRRGVPTIMVPTTAGTGAEVTPNAIVLVPEDELKVGIVSRKLMADCVILDPLLTVNLPPAITAATGMDALTHAIECYTSKKANPLSDMFALRAISLISRSLRKAYTDGADIAARHDMLLGALFGGICIATSSTTAVHALAYPLGGKYRMPHGLSNAILLPHVMRYNLEAAEVKFRDIAQAMGISTDTLSIRQAAEKMIENLFSLASDLNIEMSLKDKGITEGDLDTLVEAAAKVTRLLDNNPRRLSTDDMREIYKKLL